MEEEVETLYTHILIKEDGTYLGWSKAKTEKPAGDGMQWIEWNKPLPEGIDMVGYSYLNGGLEKV